MRGTCSCGQCDQGTLPTPCSSARETDHSLCRNQPNGPAGSVTSSFPNFVPILPWHHPAKKALRAPRLVTRLPRPRPPETSLSRRRVSHSPACVRLCHAGTGDGG